MKKEKLILFCSVLIFVSGCGEEKKDSKLYFNTTTESSYAWQDNPPPSIIWSNNAHSGNYVCKLDSVTPYGVTFNMKVSEISAKPLESVRIGAWVNMSNLVSNLVIGVDVRDSSKKSIEWISKSAKDFVTKPNQWEQIWFEVDLREKKRNERSNYLRIYLLNPDRGFALVDDMDLQFKEQ